MSNKILAQQLVTGRLNKLIISQLYKKSKLNAVLDAIKKEKEENKITAILNAIGSNFYDEKNSINMDFIISMREYAKSSLIDYTKFKNKFYDNYKLDIDSIKDQFEGIMNDDDFIDYKLDFDKSKIELYKQDLINNKMDGDFIRYLLLKIDNFKSIIEAIENPEDRLKALVNASYLFADIYEPNSYEVDDLATLMKIAEDYLDDKLYSKFQNQIEEYPIYLKQKDN